MAKAKEPYLFAKVVVDCAGVKPPSMSGQKPKYKNFKIGSPIIGRETNVSQIPTTYSPAFKTKDGYIITLDNIMILGEEQEGVVVEEKAKLSDALKRRMNKYSRMDGSLTENQTRKSKYAVNGAMFGGGAFLLYAMAKGNNKVGAATFGIIIGSLVGKFVAEYRNK